ncbi:MAG: NAD(P)/FAD-dependent oxidoreductase [Firmicutes bacterium]|nr:NAD(P)/FAD-dependent oxidoreductase [Bacillota bacterium]
MKKIIVIGGGPAGMLAAGLAAQRGMDVTLLEKNEKLGKKLFITGKGRCNVTNNAAPETLIANIVSNPYFLYSAFYSFTSQDTMAFFEKMGIPLKTERGNRVFPVSDKSSDIIKGLKRFLDENGVKIKLNTKVSGLICEESEIKGVELGGKKLFADAVVIATGGLSYPSTGSDGDGYKFAKKCGHSVTKLYPSLVPLKIKEKWCAELMGLSLKNVSADFRLNGKSVYRDMGEMMFTHFGITGPLVLTGSAYLTRALSEGKTAEVVIDLKPALDEKTLDNRILKDFAKYTNKSLKNALNELLPQKLIPVLVDISGIDPEKKVNGITREERQKLLSLLKGLRLTVTAASGFNEAVITSGGINVDEIDPSTMQSKIVKNLFFCGEVIDIDAFTGGFNLQIAFSTAYLAGTNV